MRRKDIEERIQRAQKFAFNPKLDVIQPVVMSAHKIDVNRVPSPRMQIKRQRPFSTNT